MDKQKIVELFGINTHSENTQWKSVVIQQQCPFIKKKCVKIRKSEPSVSIGTCAVVYGKSESNIIICPHRLIENNQIFLDCIHLLSLHEPGNELHIIAEITIPGGSVDYVLVSAKDGKVKDFVVLNCKHWILPAPYGKADCLLWNLKGLNAFHIMTVKLSE